MPQVNIDGSERLSAHQLLKKTYLRNSVINRTEPKPETKIKWNLEIGKWENKQDPQPELTLPCVCYLVFFPPLKSCIRPSES